jgi:hypothetical protein
VVFLVGRKKSFFHKVILLSIFTFIVLVKNALGNSIILNWDPVTEADLAGYKLYYGTSSGSYDKATDIGKVTSYEVTGLVAGETYFFALTAYDKAGNEGEFSQEVSITIEPSSTTSSNYLLGRKDGIDHNWTKVTFPIPFSTTPYVYANIDTERGPDSALVDIKDVSRYGFWVRVEEDPLRDGKHIYESISWLAVETPPPGGEVGSVNTDHNWVRVNFSRSYSTPPEVIANIVTENGSDPCHVDIRNVTTTGFEVRVEENVSKDGLHVTERIDWLAIESISVEEGEIGEVVADHNWTPVTFEVPFTTTPVVLATIKTENGGQSCHVDIRNLSTTGFEIRLEEDVALDNIHLPEEISWIALNIE